ncbi:TatD family hydrolase [Prolixibacter sp. NT017]|uniref:TatD family hydrolase n=1 Tax=Prolixibacter sp. NT017 TaxID=2652390 RepID=UPI00128A21E6|nr:TatD family hydrolase [Prolixibacter sp. NT017]GET25460.1 TatD family hydrolase [Prolixibacter sp. NT017]
MPVPYIDIHTHDAVEQEDLFQLQSLFLQDFEQNPSLNYPVTAGIHPWHAHLFTPDEAREMLERNIGNPYIVGIGETGLDRSIHTSLAIQEEIFQLHIEAAEKIGKPLIIHCVRCWQDVMRLKKNTSTPWILHGYTGNLQTTQQLLKKNFIFSIGSRLLDRRAKLRESIEIIPIENLFIETDDTNVDIREIYNEVALLNNMPPEDLKIHIFGNLKKIFGPIVRA